MLVLVLVLVLVAAEGRDFMRQACRGADVRDLEVKVGKPALEFSSDGEGADRNNTIEILALPAQVGGCKQGGQVGGGGGELAIGRGVRRGTSGGEGAMRNAKSGKGSGGIRQDSWHSRLDSRP